MNYDDQINELDKRIQERIKSIVLSKDYKYIPNRIISICGKDCTLWYYMNDNGTLEPIVAFSGIETSHTEPNNKDNIIVTFSCRELPMSVFKPKT